MTVKLNRQEVEDIFQTKERYSAITTDSLTKVCSATEQVHAASNSKLTEGLVKMFKTIMSLNAEVEELDKNLKKEVMRYMDELEQATRSRVSD